MVEQLLNSDRILGRKALDLLSLEVKNATTSMTSIPKPLKFINPHYDNIIEFYNNLSEQADFKLNLADFIAVLSMTMAEEGKKACLNYLLVGTLKDI